MAKITINQIAEELNLSRNTISKVLNQKGGVSEKTEQLVLNYAKQMDRTGADYIDKEGHMMLSLANRQTDLLCEILKSDSPEEYFFDSYSEVLKNLEGCVS